MNYFGEYNKPIPFKGDIVITDPCYLMRKEEDSLCLNFFPKMNFPSQQDFFEYGLDQRKYPDFQKRKRAFKFEHDLFHDLIKLYDKGLCTRADALALLTGEKSEILIEEEFSEMYRDADRRYHEAMEKYHAIPHDDWDYCNGGEYMDLLGITHSAITETLYGDWSCTTFKIEDEEASAFPKNVSQKPLGEFCADAGLVGVFLVEEVEKYNPQAIATLRKQTWCATFIDDFDGTVSFEIASADCKKTDENENYYDKEVRLVGDGNIKFVTGQTGF